MGDDEEIQGPPDTDNYNGPHGLKPGVENRFLNIFQCTFECTAMNQYFSKTCCLDQYIYMKIHGREEIHVIPWAQMDEHNCW